MSTNKKILTGILAALPLVLSGIFLSQFFNLFIEMFSMVDENQFPAIANEEEFVRDFMGGFLGIVPLIFILAITSLVSLIYFIVHVAQNQHIDSSERVVWILVMVFAHIIGAPLYWLIRIWPEPKLVQEAYYFEDDYDDDLD